jgi:protein gp37
MNKTKIEWTEYTWNPVVGCKNGCWYCYAKRMNDRFGWIEDWNKPQFFINRLDEPYRIKKPSKIFVGSMCDLFGDWVKDEWIREVIIAAKNNPHHTFQFLTKNSKRYLEFRFPKNCWLGITITGKEELIDSHYKIRVLKQKRNFTFISFEPLLNKVNMHLTGINLVIVGGMTGAGAIKPKKDWIESIKHPNIFYKNNIKKYL